VAQELMIIALCCATLFAGCAGTRPSNLGVHKGKLAPCPKSPNCVSSQSDHERHRVSPFRYDSSPESAFSALKRVVRSMERTNIVTETDNYFHAEFKSALMGFVDDIEFYHDEREDVIHVRSASRVGYSDFGVNRRRVESIRERFNRELKE